MKLLCSSLLSVLMLTAADAADKQTYQLAENVEKDAQVRERVHLKVTGKIRTENGLLDMAGQALLEFEQKIQEIGPDQLPSKVVRYYPDARAKFVVGQGQDSRQLRLDRRYIVGNHEESTLTLWAPEGPLTSDERELIEDVIDTTRLAGLLPENEVTVGDTWEPQAPVLKALCDLQNFIEAKVQCTLSNVNETHATIDVAGSVHGLSLGAEVKTKIAAKCTFNLESKLIDQVQWSQTDSRGPSPIAPAGDYSVTIAIARAPATSEKLSEEALAGISLEPKSGSLLMEFNDPNGRYRFFHDRSWHLTMLQPESAVMRRLEGSVFVSQLNIKVMKDQRVGAAVTADQMQQIVQQAAGWQVDEVIRMDELPTDGSFRLHMLAARGKQGEVALSQKHYLANSSTGEQVIFSFITEQVNEEQLGTKDLSLVSSVEFPHATAAKPSSGVK